MEAEPSCGHHARCLTANVGADIWYVRVAACAVAFADWKRLAVCILHWCAFCAHVARNPTSREAISRQPCVPYPCPSRPQPCRSFLSSDGRQHQRA